METRAAVNMLPQGPNREPSPLGARAIEIAAEIYSKRGLSLNDAPLYSIYILDAAIQEVELDAEMLLESLQKAPGR